MSQIGHTLLRERSGATTRFGDLLRRLRKRAGMTQDDLAVAVGYSRPLVAALERGQRLPDVDVVIRAYLPALGLQEEPRLAAQFVELAAQARGERPPATLAFEREPRVAPGGEGAAAASRLPASPTEILGREHEIDEICARLLEYHGRLLTLVGPPGVGKTRLAHAVAAACEAFYRDGATLVALASVSDPALLASALLAALQLQQGPAPSPQARLIEQLRRREMLLVLDNFEQLVGTGSAAVALVAELLAECPGLRILVTSRERLHLRAEQRYLVPPLALGAAVDLFVRRAAAVDSGFSVTASNRPIIEAICRMVDCLPLALELCAAQMDLFSPPELLARLQLRRLEWLADGAHDAPARHRTLRDAIAGSYALLDAEERALFRSLGVFTGGCDLEAIEMVGAWSLEPPGRALLPMLHALIGKSLVRAETTEAGATRYLQLETIREFALEQLRVCGEEELVRQRHYGAYLHLFREGDKGLRGLEPAAWLTRLQIEQDNLRAALQWALDTGRYTEMAWLLEVASWFWFQIGNWVEKSRWLTELLAHRGALDVDLRLATLISYHAVARAWNQSCELRPYTLEMRGLVEESSDKLLQSGGWHYIGCHASDLSERYQAFERAIACARAVRGEMPASGEFGTASDADFTLGVPLWVYAYLLVEHGKFERAAPLLEENASLFREHGSRYLMAPSLGTAGRMALLQGNLAKAQALLHEAVILAGDFNYQEMLGTFQPLLGLVTLYDRDVAGARRLLDESLHLSLELGDKAFLTRVCTCLAEAALWEGGLDEAEKWLVRSLGYQEGSAWSAIFPLERVLLAARLATAQGAYARAASLFGLAQRMQEEIGYEPAGPIRELADAGLAKVRGALDPAIFAWEIAAGRQLSLGEAFAALVE